MEIWIATGNKGKLKEFESLMKGIQNLSLHHQGELAGFSPRPEDGKTFEDNARIKTKTLHSVRPQFWTLGEDSGIEVTGLGNLPGIHSARYAGPKASDNENNAKLLKMMQIRNVTDRSARFFTCLIAISPEGEEHVFTGSLQGKIAPAPKGLHGFGYDPVFIPDGQTQTLAELGPGWKNQHSHRTQAVKNFLSFLQEKGIT